MNLDFFSDIRRQLEGFYRSRGFPPAFFIGCFFLAGYLEQWVLAIVGLLGFLYFQFFGGRDR